MTVSDVSRQEDGLVFHLTLRNFWTPLKKISVTVLEGENEKPIPYKIINNHRLTLHVREASLSEIENRLKIQLFINGQRMWITVSDDSCINDASGILLGGKYIITRVDRSILLYRKFAELKFHTDTLPVKGHSSGYTRLALKTGRPLDSDFPDQPVQLYAFQNHKLRILECPLISEDCFEITDFTALSLGTWRLFLHRQGVLYPLVPDGSWQAELKSFNHEVTLKNQYGYACLFASAHTFKPEV